MIHYLLSGSYKLQSLVMSDYELLKSNQLYEQKLNIDEKKEKPHDAYMGLGINFFFMNDFEAALQQMAAAFKLQPNLSIYQFWLGINN